MKQFIQRTCLAGFLGLLITPVSYRSASAQLIGTCPRSMGEAYLDGNNVSARIVNTGGLFYRGEPHEYRIPRFSESNAIFAAAIWIGGMIEGQLHISASRYGRNELWAGPLDDNGNPPTDCSVYDRLYKLRREEISEYESTGIASKDLVDWPTGLGAPTVDASGNVIDVSKQPFAIRRDRVIDLVGGERPVIDGDQSIWWIMNDRGNVHESTKSPAIGLEVHATAFAASTSINSVNDATLYRYILINKNESPLKEAYFGMYVDPDLGDFDDDLVGSDSTLGIGYVYNADNDDGGGEGYGSPVPAVGFHLFHGPEAPVDGLDNDKDGEIDEPGERRQMTNFMFHSGGGGVTEDPTSGPHYYGYMRSLWKDNKPMTLGGNGRDFSEIPARWFFSGNPVTGEFWSERNSDGIGTPIEPGDRRFMFSTGPFDLDPGEMTEIVFSVIWALGEDHLDSITEMKKAAVEVRSHYEAGFSGFPKGPSLETEVVLVSPANGMAEQPLNPTIHWVPTDDAEGYRVEIKTISSSFETTVRDTLLVLDNLDLYQLYWWRVRAENKYGAGPWSQTWQFSTGAVSYGYDIDKFLVVQNADGALNPPDIGTYVAENLGFPSLPCPLNPSLICTGPTPGYQQSTTNATWGIHTSLNGSVTFERFTGYILRRTGGNVKESLGFDDFEWRFSKRCADNSADCIGWRHFNDEKVIQVPFEIWNVGPSDDPSDDFRMIPAILNKNGTDDNVFDIGGDHSVSDGDNDPFSDRVYWFNPLDKSPGESGYQAFAANPGSSSPALGNEVISRLVLVQVDGGLFPPYVAALPEAGTVFRIATKKPTQPALAAPGNESRVDSGRVAFYWSGTGPHRLQVYKSDVNIKVYDEVGLFPGIAVDLHELGSYLWHVQTTNGIWSQLWGFEVVGDEPPSEEPDPSSIQLFENYPNPFRTITEIRYSLPQLTAVRLEVYNVLGERVRVLEERSRPSGEYVVAFDATSLASGVYFYTLTAGEFSQTRKMVVVK